jgi:hypothetical protein
MQWIFGERERDPRISVDEHGFSDPDHGWS